MMAQGLGCYKSVDARKAPVCTNLRTSAVDPKFQSNLVSRNGTEVYRYPSPLHAVALQSPIFSNGELATPGFLQGQGSPMNNTDSLQRAQMAYETKNHGYIDKLLLRSLSKMQTDTGREILQMRSDYQMKPTEVVSAFPEVALKNAPVVQPLPAQTTDIHLDSNPKEFCMTYSSLERADNAKSNVHTVKAPEVSYRYSYPVATKEYSSDEVTSASLRRSHKHQGQYDSLARSNPETRYGDNTESRPQESSGPRPVMVCNSRTEESRVFEAQPDHTASPEFVHAKFVPAGSERVRVRQADRKTKAVKLRRKTSEKLKTVRQHHGSSEKSREVGGGSKGEPRISGKGKGTQKLTTPYVEERKHGSGSDSSHSSPGLMYTSKNQPKLHPVTVATKSSKSRRLQNVDYEHPGDQRKKRQGAAKWPSEVETIQASCAQRHMSKGPQAVGGVHMVRSMSVKSGQWRGPHRSFQSSISSNSFFHNLNARYPPAPFHMSSLYPPRCESEYSAECASLFHSTIAESTDGEISDNTTNCFGDSESSQSFQSFSDSDSSLSLDEEDQVDSHREDRGGLVWADGALGPTAAGQPLQRVPRPEPSACRIKASRALKKKIRRFQPASLKVMTLV